MKEKQNLVQQDEKVFNDVAEDVRTLLSPPQLLSVFSQIAF